MKAIIFGSNGYIGKHLALQLDELKWELRRYDVQAETSQSIGIYQSLDITNKDAVQALDLNVDFIFFMSGITGTAQAFDHYENYINVNEIGLLHLLDAIRRSGSKASIVYPSTRLVYKGVKDTPLVESAQKEFKTIYAVNKWSAEQLLAQYASYYNIRYRIVRICVPYGTLLKENYSYGTVGFFLSKASRGEAITLYGDGSQRRTFTHVSDVCHQVVSLIALPQTVNDVYNINGESYSLLEFATLVSERYNTSINFTSWPSMDLKLESGDTIFDGSKIKAIVENTNKYSVKEWVRSL